MEDDDDLYSQLYGEAAPAPLTYQSPPSTTQAPAEAFPALLPRTEVTEGVSGGGRGVTAAAPVEQQNGQRAAEHQPQTVIAPGDSAPVDDDEDELDIQLINQGPEAEEEDEELDITLSESGGADKGGLNSQKDTLAHRYVRPGVLAPPRISYQPPPARHTPGPPDQTDTALGAAARAPPLGSAGMSISNEPAALPSQAAPGQKIRLPGQTRVTPEEYKEFLGLGHGEIFGLDIDRVAEATWRQPGVDQSDYFNYGLTARTWKDYCNQVRQFQLEFTMQKKIQVHEGSGSIHMDPDLPPELAAAVAAERRQAFQTSALHRPAPPTGPRPLKENVPHRRQLSGLQDIPALSSVKQDLPSSGACPLPEQGDAGTHLSVAAFEGPSGSNERRPSAIVQAQSEQKQPRSSSQQAQGNAADELVAAPKRYKADPG